jgi:hypothetical protein
MSVIPVLGRQRKEDQEFETSLGYTKKPLNQTEQKPINTFSAGNVEITI